MLATAASLVGREVDADALAIVAICAVVLLGILVAIVYLLIRFRRSRAATTRQIDGQIALEVGWTVIPTLIFIALFFLGFKGFIVEREAPPDAMEVVVQAQQWSWTFTYPGTGVTVPELWLPVDRPVKFQIRSMLGDVVHSFFIPAFRVKEDAVPGMDTFLWIRPDETGTYNIFCAEFCGKDHSRMTTLLHVVPENEFRDWMDKAVIEKFRPIDAAAAMDPASPELKGYDGKALFGRYCAACHGQEGEGGGPMNARNFTKTDGWKRGPRLVDIFTTISLGLDGTQMRSFRHLPVRERFALMHRVASFLKEGTRPPTTDADVAALKTKFPETDPATYKATDTTKPAIPIEEAMRKVVEEAGH